MDGVKTLSVRSSYIALQKFLPVSHTDSKILADNLLSWFNYLFFFMPHLLSRWINLFTGGSVLRTISLLIVICLPNFYIVAVLNNSFYCVLLQFWSFFFFFILLLLWTNWIGMLLKLWSNFNFWTFFNWNIVAVIIIKKNVFILLQLWINYWDIVAVVIKVLLLYYSYKQTVAILL